MSEMKKLCKYLYEEVDGADRKVVTRPCLDGDQVVVYDADGRRLWDAVCHSGSYGGSEGYLEVMEQTDKNYVLTEEERSWDDVKGYLTAEDIIERLKSKSKP